MASRLNVRFENVLEKVARIVARQNNIEVVIQGNTAYTNGKRIVLPMLEDVTEELKADLGGFLDHEVAHCKYTDFEAYGKIRERFLRELVNAIEDSRIELLLPLEYPGTALSLERLNLKWQSKLDEKRHQMPWPIRLILSIRDIYDGKALVKDEQIEPLLNAILPECKNLKTAKSTPEVIKMAKEIIRLVNLKREELFKEKGLEYKEMDEDTEYSATETSIELDPDRKKRDPKEAKNEHELIDPATEAKDKAKGEDSEGAGKEDESGEGESDGENSESDGKSEKETNSTDSAPSESTNGDKKGGSASGKKSDKTKDGDKSESEEGDSDSETSKDAKSDGDTTVDELETRKNYAKWVETPAEAQMLSDKVGDKSEFDNHEFSTESYMDTKFEEAIAKEPDVQSHRGMYHNHRDKINPKHVSIPYTKEYDKVTDYSGRGDRVQYAERKRMIMKHVNPIKQHLERVLKVKENRKMNFDRERGAINQRALAKLCIDKNYQTPFRQFTKVDTSNVAVSLVIDCSGSMSGNKIEVARQTGLALGESLKALGISFEMVGFNTTSSFGMYERTKGLDKEGSERFNRFGEALNHMIFKSFDSTDLSGICRAEAGGANADGESITWAAKRLALRREKRKIMIVLSDGQPSYSGANHVVLAGDLKRVTLMLPKIGIETIGVGIQDSSVQHFYEEYVVINDISKLSSSVVRKLALKLEEGYKRAR